MFIVSKNHILIPGVQGQEMVRIPRGYMGEVPDWVGGTAYFQSLVRAGKIAVTDKSGKPKKPKKAAKPSGEDTPPAEETAGTPPAQEKP